MRKDNWAYFVTVDGKPVCTGALELDALNKIPINLNLKVGEPKIIKIGSRFHILLPIRQNDPVSMTGK